MQHAPTTIKPAEKQKSPKLAAAASFVGSLLEYYDYMLYALAAALVFPHVFFPESDPAIAVLLSLATYGVSYAARPIGAIVLGTAGDHLGRKKLLMYTILVMGGSTLAIGLLPGYATIGLAAPILLVFFRILQGFSTAAEGAAASAMSLEHAIDNRRSFTSSWTMAGVQGGQGLASLVFIPVALLPDEQLYSWGWRIPFLLSAFVVIFAFVLRRMLPETPEFKEAQESGAVQKVSIISNVKATHRGLLRVLLCSFYAVPSSLATVFALSYSTSDDIGMDSQVMLTGVMLANFVAIFVQPLWGLLADTIGRKPVWIGGTLASVLGLWGLFAAIDTGNEFLVIAMTVVFLGGIYSACNGTTSAFFTEMFPTHVRTFGMAVGMQIGLLFFGFAPTIAQSLGGTPNIVIIIAGVAAAIASISALTARETYKIPMSELNRQ